MLRTVKVIARGLIVAMTAYVGTAVAEPYVAHTDLELRVGEESLDGRERPYRLRTNVQVFADRLFPIRRIGDGVLEIGPYAKVALLDGVHVPQIAGGAIVGYRFGRYEFLVNIGLAYATEEIGRPGSPDSSQTKTTYDVGISLRYDIKQYYFSVGYQHNSNGEDFGINLTGKKDQNPGVDALYFGAGFRF